MFRNTFLLIHYNNQASEQQQQRIENTFPNSDWKYQHLLGQHLFGWLSLHCCGWTSVHKRVLVCVCVWRCNATANTTGCTDINFCILFYTGIVTIFWFTTHFHGSQTSMHPCLVYKILNQGIHMMIGAYI